MLMLPPVQRPGAAERGRARPEKARRAEEAASAAETPRVDPVEDAPTAGGSSTRSEPRGGGRSWAGRSYAPLVAQLIAGALGFGQTRTRRRAAMADALAAYRKPRDKPKSDLGVA